MTSEQQAAATAMVCDMTGAPDTAAERMAEYGRLFARALVGRERAGRAVRLRFRAVEGMQAWVADLAAREKACCPFYEFTISTPAGEVWWEITVVDGLDEDMAQVALDEFYQAPDTVAAGVAGMRARFAQRGLALTVNEAGTVMQLQHAAGQA
jgi:hypothetical protein